LGDKDLEIMPISDRKLLVFLCHASQDPALRDTRTHRPRTLLGFLTEGWIDPWLDEEKLN
jgi:hypothetical protein